LLAFQAAAQNGVVGPPLEEPLLDEPLEEPLPQAPRSVQASAQALPVPGAYAQAADDEHQPATLQL
jgi:hypothetical protein